MGGSFDPPHHGHIALARHAARQLGLDRVLLVPVGVPPHKPDGPVIPAEMRLMMVAAAAAADPVLEASRLEIDRPGLSFTVDTLERIAHEHPDAEIWFILGADQLAGFAGWHRPERVVEIARLAVARRPGAVDPRAGVSGDHPAAGRVDLIDMPEAPISSTIVRERIARGEDIRSLVPDAVADILADAPPS
jgi:nicotinate-nucleotide adenylyltransferase